MQDEWTPIAGYEGLYEVNRAGQIRSLRARWGPRIRVMKQSSNGRYLQVTLTDSAGDQKSKAVAPIVASAFIPRIAGKSEVNHKNGDRCDNSVSNLEWGSHSHNIRHADRTGLRNIRGERNKSCRFTDRQIDGIRALLALKVSYRIIGEQFNISKSHISRIARDQARTP